MLSLPKTPYCRGGVSKKASGLPDYWICQEFIAQSREIDFHSQRYISIHVLLVLDNFDKYEL